MTWLRDYGFSALKYLSTAESVGNYATNIETLNTEQSEAYTAYSEAYSALQQAYDQAAHSLTTEDSQLVAEAQATLRTDTQLLAKAISYGETMRWNVDSPWCADTGINEVYVDFR